MLISSVLIETETYPFTIFSSIFYRKKWKYYNKLIIFIHSFCKIS